MADIIVILFGITLLFASITNMLKSIINILVIQGLLLFVLTIMSADSYNVYHIAFIGLETLLIKAILIPYYLQYTIRKNGVNREVEPSVSNFFSLFIMTLTFALGFFLAMWAGKTETGVHPLQFGIAFATILKGLFVIIANKKLITHLIGYLIMENGIFLLSLSAARDLPYIISLGVSLDIMIAVLVAGLFMSKIRSTFDEQNVDALNKLRD